MAEKEPEVCWYHKHIGVTAAASHYGRHYCPSCQRCDIIAICDLCRKAYEAHIRHNGNYPFECPTCKKTMDRRVVGAI